jgi:hypothetical protein
MGNQSQHACKFLQQSDYNQSLILYLLIGMEGLNNEYLENFYELQILTIQHQSKFHLFLIVK